MYLPFTNYREEFYQVLQYLADHVNFHHIPDVLDTLSIPDPKGTIAKEIKVLLVRNRYAEWSEEDKVMILGKGRSMLSEHKKSTSV